MNRVLPFPGREHVLEWLPGDEVPTELAIVDLVVSAVDSLRDVVRPLSAELALCICDELTRFQVDELRPARPFQHVRIASLPEGVVTESVYTPSQRTTAERLDRERLRSWMVAALDQPAGGAQRLVSWHTLDLNATCARLGEAAVGPAVELEGGLRAPVTTLDGATWACGPIAELATQPPMAVSMDNMGGALRLSVTVHWSPWADADAPGTRALEKALTSLRDQGWQTLDI